MSCCVNQIYLVINVLVVHLGFELLESSASSLIVWTENIITWFLLRKNHFVLPWDVEGNVSKH